MKNLDSNNLQYFIADVEKQMLYVYRGAADTERLLAYINSIPKITKEQTFPILEFCRIDGKITCNLERYFKKDKSFRVYYHILEYEVDEDNIDDKTFLNSEDDCNTIAYNVHLKWEEAPDIIKYILEKVKRKGKVSDIDFPLINQYITGGNSQEKQDKILFTNFMQCFDFKKVDQFSFEEVQTVLDAEKYQSLKLLEFVPFFNSALENGIKNYQFLHSTTINKEKTPKEENALSKEEHNPWELMAQEKNAFGNYVAFLKGINPKEANPSFYLTCLSDEGDLYRYHVQISLPTLFQFMTNINQNYKVQKERIFEEVEWDCYENKPIISSYLDKDIVENNGYQIVDFEVKEKHIHIRSQKAESVYVKWEETVSLISFINQLISFLTEEKEVDWSSITKHLMSFLLMI